MLVFKYFVNCMKNSKLCCIFNYAPLYRKSIYNKIDNEFDAQFYFSDMESDIAKMDYSDFKKPPKVVYDRRLLGLPIFWRFGLLRLAFKDYQNYLVIGDGNLAYLLFIPLCHLFGKRVYAWGHGYKNFRGKTGWLQKWIVKHFDVFFVYGEKGKERMVDLGIPSSKMEVIYNSLNEGVSPSTQSLYLSDFVHEHYDNRRPVLLFVGRLTAVKQLNWIIDAQEYHRSKGVEYNVLLIGDGPEKASLEKLVEDKNLKRQVWFYGPCYDEEELSRLLYNTDLCVSPGNVGLTAIHAMIYGTPVISNDDFETQMPEYESIISGKTGELYKKNNFEDFCDKIENWLLRAPNRDQIRYNCYSVINDKFNSCYQIGVLKSIIKFW